MNISMTFDQLLRAMPTLNKLATTVTKPQALVYKLSRIVRTVRPELEHFESKRTELLATYGTPRPSTPEEAAQLGDATVYDITPEQRATFEQAVKELLSVTVELSALPLPAALLDDVELTAMELLALDPFIAQHTDAV